MKLRELLAVALDPSRILRAQGYRADPWQRDLLLSTDRQVLVCCSRGAGKSRAASALALHTALFQHGSQILLLSRTLRQSLELFRYVKQGYTALGEPVPTTRNTETRVELSNGSRIIALPGKEASIRSFQGVHLLLLDEAARVPEELFASVRPMTGVVNGRMVCLSTPYGQRGFFWRSWVDVGGSWRRFRVPWQECPRLRPEFIAEERRQFGEAWVQQEYECDFTACEGLVYPGLDECVLRGDWRLPSAGRHVGGIDWGYRNPFAAVWGLLDRDDVLWLVAERYLRQTPLHQHAAALPRPVQWYADPSGATEIQELRAAGLAVRPSTNDIRAGIQAVTARLQTGRLKIDGSACPNLLAEARLYRYPPHGESSGEQPLDDHNHALDALRYLVSKLDATFMARQRRASVPPPAPPVLAQDDPRLWTSISSCTNYLPRR